MKTKLLRKLRKRFDWKFVVNFTVKNGTKVMVVYDKKWNWIQKNYPISIFEKTDLEYLLEEFGNKKLKEQYGRKKMKLKFDKLCQI